MASNPRTPQQSPSAHPPTRADSEPSAGALGPAPYLPRFFFGGLLQLFATGVLKLVVRPFQALALTLAL